MKTESLPSSRSEAESPQAVRQFQIRHLFTITATFAAVFSVYALAPKFGLALVGACVAFWSGLAAQFLADLLDGRPVENRGGWARLLGMVGAMLVWLSVMAAVFLLPAAAYEYRTQRLPKFMQPISDDLPEGNGSNPSR